MTDERVKRSSKPVRVQLSSVQSLSHVWLFAIPWTAAHQPPYPSPTPKACSNSCPSSWWCHPIISSSVVPFSPLQSFPPSGSLPMSQLFASGGQTIKSFSFSIRPSNEYSGLISFMMNWFDLRAVQGTLKSLLQQFKSINYSTQLSLWSNSHIHTWLLELWLYGPLYEKWCLCFLICCLDLSQLFF